MNLVVMILVGLLFFVSVPIIEIGIFISVGARIGLWPTLAIVVATAVVGIFMLRRQGLQTLVRARTTLNDNRAPVVEVVEGLCLIFTGLLLLTPGFMTDAAGFVLLVPPLRARLARTIAKRVLLNGRAAWTGTGPTSHPGGPIIDGDYFETDPGPGPDVEALPPGQNRKPAE